LGGLFGEASKGAGSGLRDRPPGEAEAQQIPWRLEEPAEQPLRVKPAKAQTAERDWRQSGRSVPLPPSSQSLTQHQAQRCVSDQLSIHDVVLVRGSAPSVPLCVSC